MANTANIKTLSIEEIDALYPVPNNTLTTDLSVAPYYDDYDKKKQFYRILYRPGYAVQARELTQSQTLLQKQLARFGQHIFKEGSIVLPGEFSIETDLDYIKIKDVDGSNNAITAKEYLNYTLTANNGLSAYVVDYMDGISTDANTKTLYIRYTSGTPGNTEHKLFNSNEVLTSNNGSVVTMDTAATGKGSRFIIREGVVFGKEHFIWFPTQSIIIDRYGSSPTCRVGFVILEEIVRHTSDTSLLDPALESSNYAAPGADRLKLSCRLAIRDFDDTEGAPDFIELFTIKEGIVTELYQRPQYNILRDELAKRTLDESGDYYVRGLSVRVRENLDVANNGGYSVNGSNTKLSVGVEPGVAYIKGYEVNKLVTDYITIDKPVNDYANVTSAAASASMGNYIIVDECVGHLVQDQGVLVYLLDQPNKQISNSVYLSSTTGTIIGTARVKSAEWNNGVLGSPTGQLAVYLLDIKVNTSSSFADVRSILASDYSFCGDIVLRNGKAYIQDSGIDTLLYYTGSPSTRTVLDRDGIPAMDYDYKRTTTAISVSGGIATVSPTLQANEELPYGTTNLGDADKREMIVSLTTDATITTAATVTGGTSNNTTGTSTISATFDAAFNTNWQVGDKIGLGGDPTPYRIISIQSASQVTVKGIIPTSNSGLAIAKIYNAGDIIDLTTVGVEAGIERTVAASPSGFVIDFKEDLNATVSVSHHVNVSQAQQATKSIRANVFVSISCSTAGTTGPFSLGFPDVFRIRKIMQRNDGVIPTGTGDTAAQDVTGSFIFDNGQRDNMYDLASITPSSSSLSSTSRLLVCFDYFEPNFNNGRGYFSIESYRAIINDSNTYDPETQIKTETIPLFDSPTSKQRYDLRNCLDFRPSKTPTATLTSNPSICTNNPSASSGLNYISAAKSIRLPVPASRFNYEYSYYLARRDLVVIDREGVITTVKGVVSSSPVTPAIPPNTMALASIYVTPYPSLAPNYAQLINRPDLACIVQKMAFIRYTMRDIGVLKDRIQNLEYYASLNVLQIDASQMVILDEFGLNRFKNGIFVNDFKDHTLGDIRNSDYRIVVDPEEKSMRPVYTMNSFYYDLLEAESTGIQLTGNIVTLPYTEEPLVEQRAVTSNRNVELSSYRFIGNLYLDPDIDVWVDTNYLPDNQITIGPSANNLPQTQVTWNDWQKKITGYYVEAQGPKVRKKDKDQWVYGGFFQNVPNLIRSKNSPRDQRVTAYLESTRTGTQTTYSLEENSMSLGDKVTDVSIIPYIRPQTIDVNVKGMKAHTKLYVFFDGEKMNEYCAPMTKDDYIKTPEQRTANTETVYYVLGYNQISGFPANPPDIWPPGATWPPSLPAPGSFFKPDYGADIVTDETGEAFFCLTLPASGSKKFRVGQKEVVVTDSPTNSIDATTTAKGYFYAQGMIQQKQETILTTRSITSNTKSLFEKSTESKVVGYINNPSCTAYSFIPKAPDGEEGVFVTSVDVWFSAKHPTLGVWFEIRVMDSAGGITRTQVPLTEIWLEADDIKVSTNGIDNPTRVTFPNPIFLYNNTEYAFVMHTVGLNPDTYIWISRLGETDINTGKKHNARPLTGTFFTTNNNLNWNIVDDIDLRIRVNRAKFTVGSGTAILGNRAIEQFVANTDYQLPNTLSDLKLVAPPTIETDVGPPIIIRYGETFYTQTLTFHSSIGDIEESDEIIVCTDYTVRSKCIKVSSSSSSGPDYKRCHLVSPCADFKITDCVTRYKANGANVGLTPPIHKLRKSRGKCKKHRTHTWECVSNTHLEHVHKTTKRTLIELDITITKQYSNGKTVTVESFGGDSKYRFKPGQYAISTESNTVIDILDVKNYRYSVVDFEPTYLTFKKTDIRFEMRPTSNVGALQDYHNIVDSKNYYYDKEMALFTKSNEIGFLSNERSNKIRATLTTTSDYMSPVLDVARTHSIYIDNLINANTIATANVVRSYPLECGSSGGEIVNKYISIPITLAEGQDAEDMLVMLTAYRPPGTDVIVFAKLLHGEDSDTIAQRPWIPLEKEADVFCSQSDRDDFRDFTFKIPQAYLTGQPTDNSPGGEFQYTSSSGILFTGFKYFQLKIALTSPNTAIIPRVADLRVIALQI